MFGGMSRNFFVMAKYEKNCEARNCFEIEISAV